MEPDPCLLYTSETGQAKRPAPYPAKNKSDLFSFYVPFVLDTPHILGSHRAAGSVPTHGNFTPPRISPSCPHCVILRSGRAVAGQEYHYTPCRSWPRRVLPGCDRLPLLAHTGQDCTQDQLLIIRWDLLILFVYHGAAPESAFAPRTNKGEVTDE